MIFLDCRVNISFLMIYINQKKFHSNSVLVCTEQLTHRPTSTIYFRIKFSTCLYSTLFIRDEIKDLFMQNIKS